MIELEYSLVIEATKVTGKVGYAREFENLMNLHRLGAVIVKGISLYPRPGNPPPRIVETACGMLNAIGLQNVGVDRFISEKMDYLAGLNIPVIVNILGDSLAEYREITEKRTRLFSWITDFTVTMDNAYQIMKGGRARWKIENETFNTLKNQGYHFGHNYGLGQKNLSMVFVMLMMLAFLVDQTQQLCCVLFRAVWKKNRSKRALWERMRSMFHNFELESMEILYRALLSGYIKRPPIILEDTS